MATSILIASGNAGLNNYVLQTLPNEVPGVVAAGGAIIARSYLSATLLDKKPDILILTDEFDKNWRETAIDAVYSSPSTRIIYIITETNVEPIEVEKKKAILYQMFIFDVIVSGRDGSLSKNEIKGAILSPTNRESVVAFLARNKVISRFIAPDNKNRNAVGGVVNIHAPKHGDGASLITAAMGYMLSRYQVKTAVIDLDTAHIGTLAKRMFVQPGSSLNAAADRYMESGKIQAEGTSINQFLDLYDGLEQRNGNDPDFIERLIVSIKPQYGIILIDSESDFLSECCMRIGSTNIVVFSEDPVSIEAAKVFVATIDKKNNIFALLNKCELDEKTQSRMIQGIVQQKNVLPAIPLLPLAKDIASQKNIWLENSQASKLINGVVAYLSKNNGDFSVITK